MQSPNALNKSAKLQWTHLIWWIYAESGTKKGYCLIQGRTCLFFTFVQFEFSGCERKKTEKTKRIKRFLKNMQTHTRTHRFTCKFRNKVSAQKLLFTLLQANPWTHFCKSVWDIYNCTNQQKTNLTLHENHENWFHLHSHSHSHSNLYLWIMEIETIDFEFFVLLKSISSLLNPMDSSAHFQFREVIINV